MDNPLISAATLWQERHDEKLIVLYTRLADIHTGELEPIAQKVIIDAQLFDFERIFVNHHAHLPHTLCSATTFETEARKLGINADSNIVVYDSQGLYAAPRVWWMFKSMGHHNVRVLDGGVSAWQAAGYPLTDRLKTIATMGAFQSVYRKGYFVDAEMISSIINKVPEHLILDARSTGRFQSRQPEPRSGVRSGHIPSSLNLPFQNVIEGGRLKTPEQLKQIFAEYVATTTQHLYFSCGSGVTACVLALAAYTLGYQNIHVYDGSWTEWGSDLGFPVER